MKRAGALLGVVVMVVAAFVVRNAFVDDGTGATPGGGDGDRADVVCAADLAEACSLTLLDVVTADAGTTADALLGAGDASALDADAWVVTAAWAELVIAERARVGAPPLFEIAGPPVASSPVTLVIWEDRDAELASRCDVVSWRCLAEQDGSALATGDRVDAAGPRVESAAGLPIAAAQMAALVGRVDFAANDFDGTVLSLADRLAGGQTSSPLRTMRSRGPGEVTAAGVLGVDAGNLSSNFGPIVSRPEPSIRADVVIVVPRGRSVDEDTRVALVEAFAADGWGEPAGTDVDDGLPGGSVLAAIRTIWNDAR